MWLWWAMCAYALVVLVVVTGLWLWAMLRKHHDLPDARTERRLGNRWIIGGGMLLPLGSVSLLLLFGIPLGQRVAMVDTEPALIIEVVAHRFWWEVRYPDGQVITANQLYVPVQVPLEIRGTTNDVIHSFWVPRLGHKLDFVPGRVAKLRLQAATTGTMRGQCAEFCGRGHAHMVLAVEVVTQAQFDAWLARRRQAVQVLPEHRATAHRFVEACGACHRVAGLSNGGHAPDLSDVGTRQLRGAEVAGAPVSVPTWLTQGGLGRLGADSPAHQHMLPAAELHAIGAWLETLGQ